MMSNIKSIIINSVFIETTSNCNLRCKHCYNDSGNDKRYITYETLEQLFKSLLNLNVQHVSISGGEPCLHPDFVSIIQLLDKYPIRYQIITNGTLIQNYLELLQKYKNQLSIQISLDGLNDVHDIIRGEGVFSLIEKNIDLIRCKKMVYFFKTTINKFNYKHLNQIVDYVVKSGGYSISFSFMNPIGRGLLNKELCLSDAQIIETYDDLKKLKEKYDDKVKVEIPNLFKNGVCPWFVFEKGRPLTLSPRIDVDGYVYLCSAFMNPKFSIGNINSSSLEDIVFKSSELNELLSFIKLSKKYTIDCPTCFLNEVCAKGCPASYLEKTNKYDDNFCNSRKIAFVQNICTKEDIVLT